jgi:hypothetical protein
MKQMSHPESDFVLGYTYIDIELNEWGNLEFTKHFVEITSENALDIPE